MEQEFCLKWNNHEQNVLTILESLLRRESLVDVTLVADGRTLAAHKFVLSASSPYFETICSQFSDKHPVIVLKDVTFSDMKALLEFMYKGEVKVPADQLGSLVKTAMSLKIKGLGDDSEEESNKTQPSPPPPASPKKSEQQSRPISPPPKTTKKLKLDHETNYKEEKRLPSTPVKSPISDSAVQESFLETYRESQTSGSDKTDRKDATPKLEVKAEVVDVSSPDIIEEPMDDYDENTTSEQGGLMHTLPGTSAEEDVGDSGWHFSQEGAGDDSMSLPESGQGFYRDRNCPTCGKNFRRTDSYSRHVKGCGLKGPLFKCRHCSYATPRKDNFKVHMQRKNHCSLKINAYSSLHKAKRVIPSRLSDLMMQDPEMMMKGPLGTEIMMDPERMMKDPEIIVQDPEVIVQDPEVIVQDPEIITQDSEIIMKDPDTVKGPEVMKDSEIMTKDSDIGTDSSTILLDIKTEDEEELY